MLNIEEIKAREQAATPGPWVSVFDLKGFTIYDMSGEKGKIIAKLRNSKCKYKQPDADFIAYARTDIPALIEKHEQDQQQIATLKKALEIASSEGNTAFETLADHHVITWEQKASNIQDNVDTWIKKAEQAQQLTHKTHGESEAENEL